MTSFEEMKALLERAIQHIETHGLYDPDCTECQRLMTEIRTAYEPDAKQKAMS